ncbi:MAG: rhodanese-like domain-containing protein [Alphaproteobacteria bacterium]|nr:rhodanese-like domain-containing protein [Alphaproteobacteria bacterium]
MLRRLRLKGRLVGPEELALELGRGDDVLVIDVRSAGEYAGGHIRGALNLPLDVLPERLKTLATDLEAYRAAPVVVVCRSENRSSTAFHQMRTAGFTNLRVLAGGMTAWESGTRHVTRGG